MTPALGYTEMKDSGLVWVGNIPSHWELIANKYVMHKEKHICDHWCGQDVMSLTMNGVIVRDLDNPTGKMPTTFDGYQFVQDGDLLMCLFDIDVTPRCVGRVFHDGVTSPAYSCFKLHPNADLGYFYYYYLMMDHTKELLHLAKNLRHSFTEEQIGQLKVPLPPLNEQQAISAFLDSKCAEIDEIITEAKASIEDYKQWKASIIYEAVTKGLDPDVEMKESGLGWLPKIPERWEVKRLKDVFSFGKGLPITKADLVDSGVAVISYGQIHSKTNNGTHLAQHLLRFVPNTYLYTNPSSLLKKGDIVLADTSEDLDGLGNAVLVDVNDMVFAGYHTIILRPGDMTFSKFLAYLFQTDCWRSQLRATASGIKVFSATQKMLRGCNVILPNEEEREAITACLDIKCSKIDELIVEKQSLISDLESYKKSLIYEVVTGKRRVSAMNDTTVVAVHPSVLAYQKALLMCRVLDLLGDDARGRIHVQKCLFAIECLLKMPFQTQYVRYEHGPYDTHITDCEALIAENDWFTIQNGSPVIYKKGAHFNAYLDEYMKVFADMDSKIKKIVEFLKPMKTSQAERIATLLAAWNDFILDGTAEPTDQQIVNEVIRNWTPNKANTQLLTWQNTMDKLKQSGFVPAGFGTHTIKKEAQEV